MISARRMRPVRAGLADRQCGSEYLTHRRALYSLSLIMTYGHNEVCQVQDIFERYETLIVEKRGAVAVVTMNRPDKLNACNTVMYRELDHALGVIESSDDIRAVVMTGAGDKAFSAGADLEELNFANLKESSDYIKVDATTFRRIESIPQPVITAVNGVAIGYGCKVAIVSDITVASERARFSLPGATLGAVHVSMLGRARDVIGRKRRS